MIKTICNNCGKSVERYPSKISEKNFCNRQCYKQYHLKKNSVTFICDHCKEEKTISKSSYSIGKSNHFCSRKCKDEWQKHGLRGSRNPFYNKEHSEYTKEKISKAKTGVKVHESNKIPIKCDWCGNQTMKTPYLIKRSENHFCSIECFGKWKSKYSVGENNPSWNHELTEEDRQSRRKYPDYYEFIKVVLKRDRYRCNLCHKSSKETQIVVHHLNSYNWDKNNRTNPKNGITLCQECHKDFHRRFGYGNNTEEQYDKFIKS